MQLGGLPKPIDQNGRVRYDLLFLPFNKPKWKKEASQQNRFVGTYCFTNHLDKKKFSQQRLCNPFSPFSEKFVKKWIFILSLKYAAMKPAQLTWIYFLICRRREILSLEMIFVKEAILKFKQIENIKVRSLGLSWIEGDLTRGATFLKKIQLVFL